MDDQPEAFARNLRTRHRIPDREHRDHCQPGTCLDCPFHRYEHGHDLSQIEPESFADLEGIVVRADHRDVRAIDASWFHGKEIRGRAVLVHTGWDAYWTAPAYAEQHPYLTEMRLCTCATVACGWSASIR